MPIYEYQCNDCGHRLEAIQKLSDAPLSDCPQCKASALQKLISAAGFRLSGSGWYETDFKNKNQRNLKDNKSESSDSKTEKKAETKSETSTSKTAAGTTAKTTSSATPAT